jgi:ACT domain-containing protein
VSQCSSSRGQGRITLSAHSHERGAEAIALIEQLAAERGLLIKPPPENVRWMLEDRRAKRS